MHNSVRGSDGLAGSEEADQSLFFGLWTAPAPPTHSIPSHPFPSHSLTFQDTFRELLGREAGKYLPRCHRGLHRYRAYLLMLSCVMNRTWSNSFFLSLSLSLFVFLFHSAHIHTLAFLWHSLGRWSGCDRLVIRRWSVKVWYLASMVWYDIVVDVCIVTVLALGFLSFSLRFHPHPPTPTHTTPIIPH